MNTMSELNYDKIKNEYNRCKTPEELMKFMDYIEYGFVDSDGKKYGSWNEENFEKNVTTKWQLSDKDLLLHTLMGHCFDQVELERAWFNEHNYQFRTYYIMFLLDYPDDLSIHTFLIYKENGEYVVFEHSDFLNKGIYHFKTLQEALDDKKQRHIAYNKQYVDITNEELKHLVIYEYKTPPTGIDFTHFINNVIDKGQRITTKNKEF